MCHRCASDIPIDPTTQDPQFGVRYVPEGALFGVPVPTLVSEEVQIMRQCSCQSAGVTWHHQSARVVGVCSVVHASAALDARLCGCNPAGEDGGGERRPEGAVRHAAGHDAGHGQARRPAPRLLQRPRRPPGGDPHPRTNLEPSPAPQPNVNSLQYAAITRWDGHSGQCG